MFSLHHASGLTPRAKKSFGNHQVIKGIDLSVDKHQVVSLIGASGSGKSTLLRLYQCS
jgi:ABC-type sugar transport system ATPase subunit